MKNGIRLSEKWANALTYVAAYLGALPFLLLGGYLFLKSRHEGVQKNLRRALFLFLIVLACKTGVSLLNYLLLTVFGDVFYGAADALHILGGVVSVGEIAAYLAAFLCALHDGSNDEALPRSRGG